MAGRPRAKVVAALVSLGLGAAISYAVLHGLGFVVQLPFTGVRAPIARAASRVYVEPVKPAPVAPSEDYGEAEPFPITRQPLPSLLSTATWYPNGELGWLPPPRSVIQDRPPADDFMAPGLRPWRQVTNNFGFADRDFVVKKPAGELRIGFFGGSLAQNGSSNEHTIAARLEAAFHESGHPEVRVLNFGCAGWVVTQELAAYAQIGVALDLDLVLLVDGANDLTGPWTYDPRPGYRLSQFEVEARKAGVPAEPLRADLAKRVGQGSDAWRARIVDAYVATARRFRKVVPERVPFVLVPQPMAPHRLHATLHPGETDPYVRHLLAAYDLLFERLHALPAAERVVVRDLRTLFQGDVAMSYWDVVHMDDRGNDLLGRALARELAPLLAR